MGSIVSYDDSDAYFGLGTDMLNAEMMLVDWVNIEQGGVHFNGTNYSLSLLSIEDFSTKEYVEIAAEYFVAHKNTTNFILGPYGYSLSESVVAITDPAQLLTVLPGSTELPANISYAFSTLPGDIPTLTSAFDMLRYVGASTVSVFKDADTLRCDFDNVMALSGNIQVVGWTELSDSDPLYSEKIFDLLTQYKEYGVETLLICGYERICTEVLLV